MPRVVVNCLDRGDLDDAPEVHHRDPITERTHRTQIMRDEYHRQSQACASEEIWGVQDWPMSYIATPETRLLTDAPVEQHGRTTASHFLDGGPAHAAAKDVRNAIEQLTGTSGWLA